MLDSVVPIDAFCKLALDNGLFIQAKYIKGEYKDCDFLICSEEREIPYFCYIPFPDYLIVKDYLDNDVNLGFIIKEGVITYVSRLIDLYWEDNRTGHFNEKADNFLRSL